MPELTIPNFFVVGAGKAGTTSLYRYLAQHPEIFMCPIKEPSYFAAEVRAGRLSAEFRKYAAGRLIDDWDEYVALFAGANGAKAIGEATPSYLWSPTAAREIRARVPEARIVMVLRDPAERAYSHYLHQAAEGLVSWSFREHLERCARGGHGEIGVCYPFLEVGLYYEQVKRYLEVFERESVRIYWYEEDWADPARMMRDLFGFLGVDARFAPDVRERSLERRSVRLGAAHGAVQGLARRLAPEWLRRRVKGAAFRPAPRIEAADRAWLVGYYRADVERLSELLGRDLGAWLATS